MTCKGKFFILVNKFFDYAYYPFGMIQPGRSYTAGTGYRYGFNGKEQDNEISGQGNQYDYGFRVYDPRLGKFLSVDPLVKNFPWWTPYQFAGNTPIQAMDLDGKEIYFYTWDQSKQDETALQKVHQIDVIEQKSDIIFLTDLFGWRITQEANLKDLGLEQTWLLYDNNWRLVPTSKLNQSLDKISKEEWGSFLTPEKYEETLQNIKSIGDRASIAVNFLMLADGIRNIYKAFRKTGSSAGSLKGSLNKLTSDEKGGIMKLVKDGHAVEIIQRDPTRKTADLLVDGLRTELKTIQNSNVNTAITKLQDAFKQGEAAILDLRKTNFGKKEVKEIIERTAGSFSDKKLPGPVKVWTAKGDYTY